MSLFSCEVILAESVSQASFGRVNLLGVNPGATILVPEYPYQLTVAFVLIARVPKDFRINNLRLSLSGSWGIALSHHLGDFDSSPLQRTQLITWSDLTLQIPADGTLALKVAAVDFGHEAIWRVIQGAGPQRGSITDLPASSLIDGRKPWSHLSSLALEVRSSLTIADQYATPSLVSKLFPIGSMRPSCQILVSPKQAKRHEQEWIALAASWRGLSVRSSKLIHDRFVIRDGEEVYAFGHSLDALESGRISFFSRIYDLKQADAVRAAVGDAWLTAQIVV